MSNSRSPTPTPSHNTSHLTSSSSRIHTHESTIQPERPQPPVSHPQSTPPLLDASDPLRTPRPTRRTHPQPSPPNRPPKRMRRQHSEDRTGPPRSSPSASSQDGAMADNETEGERGQQSELSSAAKVAPKKKRTRTLTTPHQSAVLHALLAESRFPTTAMREEVGRSIGLSARKVQIWFQNQRQKARRPRSQSATPLTRPPQFGPFPTLPPAPETIHSPGTAPEPGPSAISTDRAFRRHSYNFTSFGGLDERASAQYDYRDSRPPGTHSSQVELGSQLLGPGVPGSTSLSDTRIYAGREPPPRGPMQPRSSTTSPLYSRRLPLIDTTTSSPSLHLPPLTRTTGFREADSSRTLPPLVTDRVHSRSSYSAPGPSHIYAPSPHSVSPSVSEPAFEISQRGHIASPQSSLFAYQLSERRSSIQIPPPFTLQPSPQWTPSSYTHLTRSGQPSWSRPPSSYRAPQEGRYPNSPYEHFSSDLSAGPQGRDSSTMRFETIATQEDPMASSEQSLPRRTRRFDPVRSSLREQSDPSTSTSSFQGARHARDGHEDPSGSPHAQP